MLQGQLHPLSSDIVPPTVHSCENPFRFVQKNFQDFGESNQFFRYTPNSFDGNVKDLHRYQLNSSDDEDISQRKIHNKGQNKDDKIKLHHLTSQQKDHNFGNQENNGCLRQSLLQQSSHSKGKISGYNDAYGSQKKIQEQNEGYFIPHQQSQTRQFSSNKINDTPMNKIDLLKAEIQYLKKELQDQENINHQLKQDIQHKKIEDSHREVESNSQQRYQVLCNRDSNSKSKDSIKNGTTHTAYYEQKKFIDELIQTNYLKDKQINKLKLELNNTYALIRKQKEEIQKYANLIDSQKIGNDLFDTKRGMKNEKHANPNRGYQGKTSTEPDLRNEESLDQNQLFECISNQQRNIGDLNEQNKQIFSDNEDFNKGEDINEINNIKQNNQLKQGEQMNPLIKKQEKIFDQLPTSTSQLGKDIPDKKQLNIHSKQNENDGSNNVLIQKPNCTNLSEVMNFGQFSLLESELFNNPNKGKDFVMNNLMELESFNLSPIRNKSSKQEKSTICDKSCLQAILGIGETSHRGIKKNTNTIVEQCSSEKLKDHENLQEELELKQSNFQNKVKKVLDMNAIKQQESNNQDKQFKQISKEDTCPDFKEFVTNLLESKKAHCKIQNNYDVQIEEQNKLLYSVSKHTKRENEKETLKNDTSGKKSYSSHNQEQQNYQSTIEQYKQNQGLLKSQSYQVKINKIKDIDQQMNRNKDDLYDIKAQQNYKSFENPTSRYSNLQIGIPCNEQHQKDNDNITYQNNQTKSDTNINSNNKINSTINSKKQTGGQIIQAPHTTKEGYKKFVFENSECSMQFKEDIDDFRKIFEGKRRSSLNLESTNMQDFQDIQNNFNPQYNQKGKYNQLFDNNENQFKNVKISIIQQEEKNKKQIDQIKSSSSQSLGASNRISSSGQQQPLSSQKKSNENNNLRLYEVNETNTTRNQQNNNDLRQSNDNLIQFSQNNNNSSSRNNRMSSITEFENKNYIVSQSKKFSTPNNHQYNHSSQHASNNITNTLSKLEQKNYDKMNEDKQEQNKLIQSHNLPFSNSKMTQDQYTPGSKKKITALSSGNAYHLQQKHHDKYDFYYLNSNLNTLNSINNQQSTSNINSITNHTHGDDQSNQKNINCSNYKSGDQGNRVSTVASSHSSEEVISQLKKLSNKSKKGSIVGMIVNTTSREQEQFPLQPATTSSLIRKQIASTVNEAVRNSSQHLQIIYNSNNQQSSQNNLTASNQQRSQLSNIQLLSSNRLENTHSIDSHSSKKNYISQNNPEQVNTQQSYHDLQNILKQHASNNGQKLNKNSQNLDLQSNRHMSSNVERLREVKNRVRDLNLNKEQSSYLTNAGQKENYPPSQTQLNNPYQIQCKTNISTNNEEYSSAMRRSSSNKGENHLDNQQQSSLARRCSQNNQQSSIHIKQNGEYLSSVNFKNEQKYQDEKLFSILNEFSNQKANTLRHEEQSGLKRNYSYNQSSKLSQQLKNESSQLRKSTDSTRRPKNYNFQTQY